MQLYKRPGSPFWWADFTPPGGERIRRSTRCRDRKAAARILREWTRAAEHATADAEAGIERGTGILMATLAAEYLAWAENSDRSKLTVDAQRRHIYVYILPHFGLDTEARTITEGHVRDFVDDVAAGRIVPTSSTARRARRRADGRPADGTVNRILVTLRRVLAFGAERKYLPRNAAAGVKARRERNAARHRALTDAEISAWLRELDPAAWPPRPGQLLIEYSGGDEAAPPAPHDVRPRAAGRPAEYPYGREDACREVHRWIRFALATGLRKGEMQTIQWSDVDIERRHVRVRAEAAKGGRARLVPLTTPALDVLAEVSPDEMPRVGAVFGPADHKRAMAAAWKRARLPGRAPTPHDLRHTCASRAAAAGAGLAELMSWLGWSEVSTPARYLHAYGDRLADLAKRMEGEN